jgi:hypothetical protein
MLLADENTVRAEEADVLINIVNLQLRGVCKGRSLLSVPSPAAAAAAAAAAALVAV